ncbi:uncharacterized protein [Atheta coriaria]|uniref:uncharacterized protein n=1 Tax=Dalotia coriaria TaxID=877792 RepID=UPI0031F4688F
MGFNHDQVNQFYDNLLSLQDKYKFKPSRIYNMDESEYLHHFKENVQPTKENPVLSILDNHSSHLSLAAINFCRDNGIHLLTLPPHSSHKMQPLDRGFFGPLKTKFAYECDKWLTSNPGRVIGQSEVAQLLNESFKKVATVCNATSGFKTSGIWPIDREIFSEEDFIAASVTDI